MEKPVEQASLNIPLYKYHTICVAQNSKQYTKKKNAKKEKKKKLCLFEMNWLINWDDD